MPTADPILLSVPNVSEGRDQELIHAMGQAFTHGEPIASVAVPGPELPAAARLLDVHSDPDHHRSVYTIAGTQIALSSALLAGSREAVRRIDLESPRGLHPHVGAIDVIPIVHVHQDARGAACAEALLTAELIGTELKVPVFLYGELAGGRTRAEIRRGGITELAARLQSGDVCPDFGPRELHPTAGATLVAARPPLVAFNLELELPADLSTAQSIAAKLREGGPEGLPGLRAIGLQLSARHDRAQVSMNVEDPDRLPLREVVDAVRRHAAVHQAELVGMAPRSAFEGFPADVPIPGFEPRRHIIEDALGFQ